ncbi:MAG: hypothetical protein Fur0039_02760 [Rhodocyclaceae bacterium]
MPLDGRQSQRQKELVAGSLAHPVDGDAGRVRTYAEQHLAVVRVIHGEPREAAQGDAREDLGRTTQERALVPLPVQLHDPVENGTGQPDPGIGSGLLGDARGE